MTSQRADASPRVSAKNPPNQCLVSPSENGLFSPPFEHTGGRFDFAGGWKQSA